MFTGGQPSPKSCLVVAILQALQQLENLHRLPDLHADLITFNAALTVSWRVIGGWENVGVENDMWCVYRYIDVMQVTGKLLEALWVCFILEQNSTVHVGWCVCVDNKAFSFLVESKSHCLQNDGCVFSFFFQPVWGFGNYGSPSLLKFLALHLEKKPPENVKTPGWFSNI